MFLAGHSSWDTNDDQKNTLRRRRQKMGGVCLFWGQTEEDWLKIVFVPGAELAQKTAGMKSVTKAAREQTAVIPPVLKTWKDGRRFLSDKTPMVVVGGRRAGSSRQKEKEIILIPTVQCQKIHREVQAGQAQDHSGEDPGSLEEPILSFFSNQMYV